MSKKNVAFVTGGTGGIGTAICQSLHDDGYTVVAAAAKPKLTSGKLNNKTQATVSKHASWTLETLIAAPGTFSILKKSLVLLAHW